MIRRYLLFYLAIVTLASLDAQKLMVTQIEETRSTNGSWDFLNLEVKLIGDEVRNYTYYRLNEITSAVDNKGINLLKEDLSKRDYVPISESFRIEMMKASRSATDVTVSGTMSLYKPTEANGGLVKIAGFKSKPGVNIAPKGALYSMFYYDTATLQKLATTDQNKRYEDMDKLSGVERDKASELEFFIQSLNYYSPEELDNSLFFIVTGDSKSIVSMEFENASGKKLSPSSSTKSELSYTLYFNEKPDANIKMILNTENPKAVKILPFTLKGVDLP
ncbi:MAG: hypothetical protein IPM42_12940 [Saprospiraceae bacterium]|nr:hypothetical protein [Saprospiraceae bacterium]